MRGRAPRGYGGGPAGAFSIGRVSRPRAALGAVPRAVEQIGFLPAADMLRCLGEIDINLAPLELGNPFCEGKRELKFFEAALVGVPTVASATETFAAAIEDGVSGFVVRSQNEWARALELLITDANGRRAIGDAARARALARYRAAALVPQLVATLALPVVCDNRPMSPDIQPL